MRIPYYPSRESRLKRLIEYIEFRPGSKVVDLGSGDGRVLRFFASRFDDVSFIGVEKDPILVDTSRKLSKEYSNIKIVKGDLFKVDLEGFDVVYSYLTTDALMRLSEKAKRFIEKGGVWIALDYSVPNLNPIYVIELDKWHKYFIYGRDERSLRKVIRY